MKRILFFSSFLFLVVAFYLMNYYEPLRCDDLIYQYYWLNERTIDLLEPIDLTNRIDDMSEAFYSQINHYFVMNGRFVNHFLVSCFCGFLGRPIFSIFNAVIYALFLWGCAKLLNFNCYLKSTSVMVIIWLGLPIQYILWYSVAFAINYLWVSTALIFFLLLFRSLVLTDCKYSIPQITGMFLFSIFLGSLHEGFSLPLCGAMFIYILVNRKTINKYLMISMLGLCLGTAFVVLAPGTLGRGTGSLSNVNIHDLLLMKLDVFRYSKRLYLFVLLIIILYFANKKEVIRFIKDNQLLIYFVAIDFAFVLAVPHYSQRIEFPLELVSLLMSISLLLNTDLFSKYKRHICSLLLAITFIHASFTVYYAKVTSNEYERMLMGYLASPDGKTNYEDIVIPKLFSSYVHRLDEGVERDFISFVYKKEMYLNK